MFRTLNTTPLNSGDISYNIAESIMPLMSSAGEVDDVFVGWGESTHSMSCSGEMFQNLICFSESSHKKMRCTGLATVNPWGTCSSFMSMVCSGEAATSPYADALSSHLKMMCFAEAETEPQTEAESVMMMRCYGEVFNTISEFEVLHFEIQ